MTLSPHAVLRNSSSARGTPRAPRFFFRALAFVALSVIPSVFAALVAAPAHHTIDWDVLGVTGTAIGTLLLAISTQTLARQTSEAVNLQTAEQRLHRSPLVIHDWSEVRPATDDEARGANRQPGAAAITVRLVNAGEGPATEVHGQLTYEEQSGTMRPLSVDIRAAVILPGRERRFFAVVGPGDLSPGPGEHFAAAQRIRVQGTFSDPRRLEHGEIRPTEPTGSGTLARDVDTGDAAADQSRLHDALAVPVMVPERPGGGSSSELDLSGHKRMINLKSSFSVQNKGPTEIALRISAGVELDGAEYAGFPSQYPALAVGASLTVGVDVPDAAISHLPEHTVFDSLSPWVRFSDRRGRRWRTVLDPSGRLTTSREPDQS